MKKILVLINDYTVSAAVMDFALELARKNHSTVYGIFVQSLQYNNDSYPFPNDINETDTDFTGTTDEEEHLQFLQSIIDIFVNQCKHAGIPFHTHSISSRFLDTLIDYSAFADLILCDADTPPTQYSMTNLLADTHCPVLMVNKDYKETNNLVLAYDDKLSSIYAIRMFTYLFSSYTNLTTYFVSVLPTNIKGLVYDDLIKEWLPLHYSNATFEIIHGDTKNELTNFINKLSNPLIVMGAYGRSSLSRFFKDSLANEIITRTNAPIFIAHN